MSTEAEQIQELQAKLDRVEAALSEHAFDVRESGMYVDNVIEVSDIRKALDGPTERERLDAEIEKHETAWWHLSEDGHGYRCGYCGGLIEGSNGVRIMQCSGLKQLREEGLAKADPLR